MKKTLLVLLSTFIGLNAFANSTCSIKAEIKIEKADNRQFLWCRGDMGDPFAEEFTTVRTFKFKDITREECDEAAQELIGHETVVKFMDTLPLGMVIYYHEPSFSECTGEIESIRKIKFKTKRSRSKY